MRAARFALPLLVFGLASCADLSPGPTDESADLNRYVAMGTSISMGVASDGVVASSQRTSWPALLAADVGTEFGVPAIAAPGCGSPLVAPLSNFKRADNSAIGAPATCAPNETGFTLPEQNVAISGATAASATSAQSTNSNPIFSRVLAKNLTQLTAMRSMTPTFVSVEFGAVELLPALGGRAGDADSFSSFSSPYSQIITSLRQTNAKALLVLLPTDLKKFPAVRTAAEMVAQRAAFAARNVSVNVNCNTSTNYVTLTGKIFPVLIAGAARAAGGLGPADLSCENVPNTLDGVLTEADFTTLNALAAQINGLITARATSANYATFSLGALYDTAKDGVPFDLNALMTSATPFGPSISLDGVHPSAAGQAILAAAAKAAIIQKYGGITH